MADLLAPILLVMNDEVHAFWCFANWMDKSMERNFHHDQTGMHTQLATLRRLVKVLDPDLSAYFGTCFMCVCVCSGV